jgi:hypothetical protein
MSPWYSLKNDDCKMITKEKLQNLISEEKERFGKYSQLCAHYEAEIDQFIFAKYISRVETLEQMIRILKC